MGGYRGTWFYPPLAELRQADTCALSGFPAGIDCENIRIAYIPRNAPFANPCPYCRKVILNETLDHRITLETGVSAITVERKWFALPPAEEWYFRRWNLDYKPLPPLEGTENTRVETVLALFNPEPEGQVYVPRELDGGMGRIVFSAAHRDEDGIIYWHLDGNYLGFTHIFHEMETRPDPGRRTLTLVDGYGNTLVRNFTVLETF